MRALGAGTVSASEHPDFTVGERVCGLLGWQEDAVVNGSVLRRVPEGVPLNASLNVLGIAGQTAWLGLHDIGKPRKGETVVVTPAAGSVGSVAVQLAVAAGARVIGVAGTPAKCVWVRELGSRGPAPLHNWFTCCSTGSGWKVSSTWTTRLASTRSKPISCPACATASCAAGNT